MASVASASMAVDPAADMASSASLPVVCKYWQEFGLEAMRTKLDEGGLKIAEHQEESMHNRKKLAEATKEFKRTASEAALKGVGPLLKHYQEEIDRLTKRSKHSESAFLEIYQKLYEAPDPAPALAISFETASRSTELEAQCKKLSQELAEYKAESTQIKNQDLTIRKLEEKIRSLEAALEEKDQQVDEVKAQAIADADAARLAQMQEREAQLTQMLTEAQTSLVAMQKLHQATQNQLFAIQSQSEEERVGRQTELELASEDLERAQERLLALEREKQKLKDQLVAVGTSDHAVSSQGTPGDGHANSSMEETLRQELHTHREVAARLRLEVASLRREIEQSNNMWAARVEGLKSTLQATEQHAHAVEEELGMRPTVQQMEELRQQVRLLQAIGYNTMDEEMTGSGEGGASSTGTGGPGHGGKQVVGSLEAMLLQKNRHVEHELTMARLKVVDTKASLDAALAQLSDLEAQVASKQQLIERLEEDVLASRGAGGRGAAGSSSAAAKLQHSSSTKLPGVGGDADEQEVDDEPTSSMVRVVCAQRDRFRHKVVELEEELNRVKAELATAKSEAAAARADNIALVERLRYVHGYKQQQGDVEAGQDVENKYGKMYDAGINPFKEFQGQQRERQKKQMNFADRIMYMFAQLVFGSTGARLFTFAYLSIMHLLVVASLVRMTHHSSGALLQHQQDVLDNRHDVTAALHHEVPVASFGNPVDSRLP